MSDTVPVWDRIARWWDEQIGEGNQFQELLIMPTTDRLLALKAGEVVLDLACGNGNYARRMAKRGAQVIAVDGSDQFLDCARKRTLAGTSIEYRKVNLTNDAQLGSLEATSFDAAVCSMALMDIDPIEPLIAMVKRVLKPDGRFVFSVPHPCFNSNRSRMTAELINESGKTEQVFGVAIRDYIEENADLSSGIINQPEPHPMFHRPISGLLKRFFASGFVVDAFEEPAFLKGMNAKSAFSWAKRPDIPPAMVVRVVRR